MEKKLIILALESSCDETSAAVLKNGREVLSNIVSSQIDLHKKFGGVVPEVASRKHVENISYVIDEALDKANVSFKDIDLIGVTYGPGLVGALLVGLSTAKALAYSLDKPLVGVNHIEGHIYANFIEHKNLEPPFICLIVSGGHTHLVYMKDYGVYEVLGKTRDDAAGEAFDKVARAIGLGYPGGPIIDKLSKKGNKNAINFPRTYLENDSLDFSFSGLKSAVLNYLNNSKMKGISIIKEDVAASFQQAVIDVLVDKTILAAKRCGVDTIVIAGGVAANSGLRQLLKERTEKNNFKLMFPPISLCTDNAAMIGCAAYYDYINGYSADMYLNAIPNLKIGQKYERI
ncbi:tRNA (adenosine(37)-N6)-threonylcarbamoyltransferase complex transferase subunit TsaD [Paramaledivibacter caminithermalis]|jgi:N6-L-threonylcarbamoyladenine synthase|uniref:tRNA N6-adenosine threonylcarbamoyltransferase n=1 Tax=Paramaledivibacter caminithermalis (strain DSM 15212 / CIP 107654 / DViRD3) TaxID=1121301 RepID=A0A1M6L8T7_PARC5|nr:tRNA (adenosine(37)-N6)-threonylcarbamoyltransferase complex transferase subunit TsaD [Paramaledivibacter caminithermalis]SHJ67617.1 O-sialoglycoprotein endopeptidase [Paramaledivibacter caminithermalis DSM 15212]